jgi:short-subunit dehydrogenase
VIVPATRRRRRPGFAGDKQCSHANRAVYAAAKAFQVTFTQALAGELDGTGVQVQACCPGLVDTEFHAQPAPGQGSTRQ